MKVSAFLLLASLASTSLAILPEPEDKIPVKAQRTVVTTQFNPSKHPKKDHVSKEDLSKEPFIFKEEMTAEENMEIMPTRPKSQDPMQPHPIPQEESHRNTMLQSEETNELTLIAATTSEGKKDKLRHKIEKNLDKIVKSTTIHGLIIEKLNP